MFSIFLLMNRISARRRNIRTTMKTVTINKKMLELDYCRTCLSTEDLSAIFYNKECEKKRTEDLRLATGLEIKLNDGLSQKICNDCIQSMESALRFRRTSRKSEKTLLNMLYGKSKKKFKTKSTNSIKTPKLELDLAADVEHSNVYEDDFQNYEDEKETDYLFNEDVKPNEETDDKKRVSCKRKREVIPNAASYKCGICSKEFRMKATYKAHLRFHTSYYVCETCGKRCRNNNQLQEHKRARHGLGRIHKCAYCEYSSATKEALTIHERRHTGERPYVCDHCGATFHRRSNLVQHIAIHLPEKNFQCDMCPKRLKSRKFLQIHKHNAHTGKRYGYLCSICEHRFEKPNKCPICFKREKSRKLLQVHEYKRHRENRYRYVCPVCKETFARPGNVRLHLVRAHNVPRDRQGQIEKYEINLSTVQHNIKYGQQPLA